MQSAQATQYALQRITAAFQHGFSTHLINAVLENAAHRLIHQLLTVGTHLIDSLIVERQAIRARLNNTVHLLFQLFIQLRQAGAHIAALTHLFSDDFIQRHAAFLDACQRTIVDPGQRGTQLGLVVHRLLALGGRQVLRFAVKGDVAIRRNHQIAILALNLHGLRT